MLLILATIHLSLTFHIIPRHLHMRPQTDLCQNLTCRVVQQLDQPEEMTSKQVYSTRISESEEQKIIKYVMMLF